MSENSPAKNEPTPTGGAKNILAKITQTINPVLFLGLGFQWVWVYALFYSSFPSLVLTNTAFSSVNYPFGLIYVIFFIIATFGMGSLSNRITFIIRRRNLQVAIAIILTASTGLLFLSNAFMQIPLLVFAESINGLTSGFLMLLWSEGYRRREPLAILSNSVLSVIFAFVLFRCIMFLLPPLAAAIILTIVPLIQFGFLYLTLHGSKAITQKQQFTVTEEGTKLAAPGVLEIPTFHKLRIKKDMFFVRVGIPFLFFGMALKLLCDLVFRSAIEPTYLSTPWSDFLITTTLPCIIILIVATIFVATNQSDDCEQYYRFILPIASVFILLACFQGLSGISSIFTSTSYLCLEFMIWMELCVISHRYRISPIIVAGFGRGALAVGMLVMTLFSMSNFDTEAILDSGLSFTFMLVMLIVGYSLLPREKGIKAMAVLDDVYETEESEEPQKQGQMERSEKRFIARCEQVANRFLLSPREVDVFFLLAKGRNTAYISKNLYISEGTVHTHMRHIYKKLDIHRQQELIDMVDAQMSHNKEQDKADAEKK